MEQDAANYWTQALAVAKSQRMALDATIASLEALIAAGMGGRAVANGSSAVPSSPSSAAVPIDLPVGALLGKSLPDAIKLYLESVKKKQTIREIATALKEGGVETTSSNFESVVTGSLNRLKKAGEVLRFSDGWAWSGHYTDTFRAKLLQTKKPRAKKKARSKREAKPSPIKTTHAAEHGGLEKLLADLLAGKTYSSHDLAGLTAASVGTIVLSLGRMAKKGLVEKTNDGKYRGVTR